VDAEMLLGEKKKKRLSENKWSSEPPGTTFCMEQIHSKIQN